MTKGNDTYFFVKNMQGDVTKIIDENGTICATYAYDAWGALLAENEDSSITGLNPFRYRGYTYDTETELYYLQSRYYDPKTGRFINADDPAYTDTNSGSPLSTNMFAYCENNAVNKLDNKGHSIIKAAPSLTRKQKIFIINAINWSGLDKKPYSISPKNSKFIGTRKEGKYKVYIFAEVLRGGAYYKTEYYVLNKTLKNWDKYIKKHWGTYNSILSFANTISELGVCFSKTPAKIRLLCGIVYMLTTVHNKSFQEKYIYRIIKKHLKKYFKKSGKYLVIRNAYKKYYKNDYSFLFSIPMFVINYMYTANSNNYFAKNKYYSYIVY